ncbi:MAG: phosphoribosylaminoimidazolesuccinocarboxamide synthase [Elusimicrobiota bacterium]|nr:phosphoribosylaminoimidazolesuccinocarboxamide synthase [Elusimicrobiota bacterium]
MSLKLFYRGKVRDVFEVDEDKTKLLIVATDRISCFDYVLPTPIPDKGKILTQLSVFWFEYLKDIIDNHLISADISVIAKFIRQKGSDEFKDRSMLVKKAKRINVECVVRGYISGSAWREYQNTGFVCAVKLPSGLRESDKLPEPIFTPATKSNTRHDIDISYDRVVDMVGSEVAKFLKEKSLALYNKATSYAEKCNIIIADSKFEFGFVDDKIILIDEIFTPDSSRFWDKEKYKVGVPQDSYDKQFVRDYLERIGWNKQPPAPELPKEIVDKTREKYFEGYKRITFSNIFVSNKFRELAR